MSRVEELIEKIKETDYSLLANGKDLKELDFQELLSLVQEMEDELFDCQNN